MRELHRSSLRLSGTGAFLRRAVLLAQLVVLAVKPSGLLLERLNVLVLLLQLLLQLRNFTNVTRLGQLLALLGVLVRTFILLDLLLQSQNLEDHNVRAVEDQRQEKRKAAEVHVSLAVKLARLN